MTTSVQIIFFLFWMAQGFVSCVGGAIIKTLTVKVGEPLRLECTYNCSTAFVRVCWCFGTQRRHCPVPTRDNSSFCSATLYLSNVSTEGFYKCFAEHTDDPDLPLIYKRLVWLSFQAQTSILNLTTVPPTDSIKGDFTGMKILGPVLLFVAGFLAVLAVYLCVSRKRRNCKGEPVAPRSGSPQPQHAVRTPVKGTLSAQSERVTLRIPPADNEDDTEVPYADIIITIRGVSTPELTQATGDHIEWWGNDSRARLQASRSADRLHVPQPREISRKMSTNSEYAVITYA